MKQTAVEWLIEELDKTYSIKEKFLPDDWEFLEEISKKMEKEQILDAFEEGMFHHLNGNTPKEYYDETFNTNEK